MHPIVPAVFIYQANGAKTIVLILIATRDIVNVEDIEDAKTL